LKPVTGMSLVVFALLAAVAGGPEPAMAQEEYPPANESVADSLETGMSPMDQARILTGEYEQDPQAEVTSEPFIQGLSNEPKAGALANVRQFTYYGDLITTLKFQNNSTFRNTFKFSWEEYRKQDKTVQKKDDNFTYGLGSNLPFVFTMNGAWNWSEDRTTNTAGFANLSKRDQKRAGLNAMKSNFKTGFLNNTAKISARIMDQESVNQNQRNDFNEGAIDGGFQSDMAIAEGVRIAGRLYGMTLEGDRALGNSTESEHRQRPGCRHPQQFPEEVPRLQEEHQRSDRYRGRGRRQEGSGRTRNQRCDFLRTGKQFPVRPDRGGDQADPPDQ